MVPTTHQITDLTTVEIVWHVYELKRDASSTALFFPHPLIQCQSL